MKIYIKVFWLQKAGNTTDEYEDAFCPDTALEFSGSIFRAAVADGAAETSFSRLWATMLVRAYCNGRFIDGDFNHIKRLQKIWVRILSQKQLPWYAEEKLRQGAFASFAGLTLYEPRADVAQYETLAIGDSCIFQFRDDRLLFAGPLSRATQFNNRPVLLSSNPQSNSSQFLNIKQAQRQYRAGDTFFLMTDALARWLLQALGPNAALAGTLRNLNQLDQQSSFEGWVSRMRKMKIMRNDDVTMIQLLPL